MSSPLIVVRGSPGALARVSTLVVVGGSTRTSTIPGVSIAGPSPEATLYTPTLDLEYLVKGKPITLPVVPVSPDGLPTPAVISRALLQRLEIQVLPLDAGMMHRPRIPHITLPSSTPGGRIDKEPAFPPGTSKRLMEDAEAAGEMIAGGRETVMIGETIPGGTTTAAAIMEALGGPGVDAVSSSSKNNPKGLKRRIVEASLSRASECEDLYCVLDQLGDPVHIAIAGLVKGVLGRGSDVVLAGGTQMGAVLAILDRMGVDTSRIVIATSRWILEDESSDIEAIAETYNSGLVAADVSFSDSPWNGLRMYDQGYVKEGVAAGGVMSLALARGLVVSEVKKMIYEEYGRLLEGASKD